MAGNMSIGAGAFGGARIVSFFGFRRALFLSMGLATVGVLFKIVDLSPRNLIIGRICHGLGAGSLGFGFGKAMNETVPQYLLQYYG